MGLSNHLYILTGTTRGLGLALAQQLLHPGHALICIAHNASTPLAEAAQLQGAQLVQWQLDLSDAGTTARRLSDWLALQPLDRFHSASLILNVGLVTRLAPLRAASGADLAHALRMGVESPWLLTAAFLQGTAAWRGPRRILAVAPGAHEETRAGMAPHGAARAALAALAETVTQEERSLTNPARICTVLPDTLDVDLPLRHPTDQARAASETTPDAQAAPPAPDSLAQALLAHLAAPDFGDRPVWTWSTGMH